MKWFKSNWAIVVLGLVALAALPTMWFFSNGWNKKLVDQLQTTVSGDYKNVTSAQNTYRLTGLTGEPLLEKSGVFNADLTKAYEELGKVLTAQSGTVGKTALDFNRGLPDNEKKLLIDGLFPEPSAQEAALKPNQFMAAYSRRLAEMLKTARVGMPPPPTELAEQLTQMLTQKQEQYRQEHGQTEMDAKAMQTLAEELFNFRLGRYQARARELQVYGDVNALEGLPSADGSDKPQSLSQRLTNCWDMQERLWVVQDVLKAISVANGDSGGEGVPGSIVKRILRVAPAELKYGRNVDGTAQPAGYEAGTDKAPLDYTRTLTGRFSGPLSNNKWYAVRNVTVDIIVDSQQLPKFIDALAKVNFMTLIGANIYDARPVDDLSMGYYYGKAHVVRAELTIETIWFRDLWKNPGYTPPAEGAPPTDAWKQYYVPRDLQAAMAMLEGVAVEEAPAAAPAPRPRPAPAAGEGEDSRPGRGRRREGGD
ncbi:MAG: hypothetical protein IT438_15270 [Phycisphaerales bacterium]|nr:hypothetical protein [Phycisphaerales bacterium]